MFHQWMKMSHDMAMLGLETQQVINLRLMKIAAGGAAADAESLLMVTEKTKALTEAAMTLATGGSHEKVLKRYTSIVRANKRRLSR